LEITEFAAANPGFVFNCEIFGRTSPCAQIVKKDFAVGAATANDNETAETPLRGTPPAPNTVKLAVVAAPNAVERPPKPESVLTIRTGDNGTYSPAAAVVTASAGPTGNDSIPAKVTPSAQTSANATERIVRPSRRPKTTKPITRSPTHLSLHFASM